MELIKDGRRIIGFIDQKPNGEWSYVFGKPSQSSYIEFYTSSREKALERVVGTHADLKKTISSIARR